MATFRIRLHPPLPAEEAWRRVLNLYAHSELVPLTRVSGTELTAEELRAGSQFTARTTFGPFVLEDPMVIEKIVGPSSAAGKPGYARIRKLGRAVGGSIEVLVQPHGDNDCRIEWTQDLVIRWIPNAAGRMAAAVASVAYRTMLRRLLA